MGNHNSRRDIYLSLTKSVYSDIATRHGFTLRESRRDIQEIESRVFGEGISFLTKTLPRLGKAIDMALSTNGKLQVHGFQKKTGTVIPRFLWSLLSLLFDSTGSIRSDATACVVLDTRQLLYLLYKLELPRDPSKDKLFLDQFAETDATLDDVDLSSSEMLHNLDKASKFLARILHSFDHKDIIPKHGPGSVATGEKVWEKSDFSRIYSQIESVYPFTDYYMFNYSHVCDQLDWLQSRESLQDGTAKVVLVPKDSRGPRLISCEPLEYQWIQQGVLRKLVPFIERHQLTAGHVNFTDQSVNRNLALSGSLDGSTVTMDMKDASDRVSLWLVKALFGRSPILESLLATRTPRTRLPDGRLVEFKKFAPMGSALCFPVEALTFYALLTACISTKHNISMRRAASTVYVYGDDIVVNSEDYAICVQFLESVNLRVNKSKCCTGPNFRESCGMDAFKGVDVTPLKVKTLWSHRGQNTKELASYTVYSNTLWKNNFVTAASFLETLVKKKYGRLPYTHSFHCGYFGFYRSHIDAYKANVSLGFRYRRNVNLQRLELFAHTSRPIVVKRHPDGWREYLRRFCGDDSFSQFGVYTLTRRSRIIRVWSIAIPYDNTCGYEVISSNKLN